MAADLSPHQHHPFCPFPVDWSRLSDPALSSPLTSSDDALATSDEDHDYLAQLTRQMAIHMIRDQTHHNPQNQMPRWVDLFTDSPRPRLWPSSSVPADKSPPEGYPSWDAFPSYEPGILENPDKIAPGLRSDQTLPSDAKWTNEEKSSDNRLERAPKQGNSGKRKPQAKNNQWKTRKGECYVGMSLPHQEEKAVDRRAVSVGDPKTRKVSGGSTGTGVFLPKTGGKVVGETKQGRKQPRGGGGGCSTVLIPARVAQALMLHFSKMTQPQQHSSPIHHHHHHHHHLPAGASFFQQKSQTQGGLLPEEPAIDCNEMGLPQEWMY